MASEGRTRAVSDVSSETLVDRLGSRSRRDGFPSPTYVFMVSLVGGIGIATLAVHLLHLLTVADGFLTTVFGALIPLGLSLALLGVVAWLHVSRLDELIVSIGLWSVVGALVLVGVSVTSITYQQAHGVEMTGLAFVIANHATVGAIMGTLLGLYDGQRGTRTSELRAERERAKRLSNRLTVLNRLLRHDIRNAVNVIRGNTELIRAGSSEVETLTETIDGKASELLELGDRARKIEALLDRDSVSRSTTDVAPVLKAKVHRLQNDHPEIDYEVDVPESVEIYSIPLIEDAIDELLENAVEHNDADSPVLSVRVPAHAGDDVRIEISDNGPGLPDSELMAIERGRETDLKHASGLGLWFVYWVLERSGGRLHFDERDPRGSTVTLVLPSGRNR